MQIEADPGGGEGVVVAKLVLVLGVLEVVSEPGVVFVLEVMTGVVVVMGFVVVLVIEDVL